MIPIKFKEATKELQKPKGWTDEECGSLWVFSNGTECISRWKISFKELLKIILFRKIWLSVYSGYTQPPVYLSCEKTVFEKEK